MMLLGIYWYVLKDSRRKAAINVLFLCEMVVSLYVVGFCFMHNIHDVHLPISIPFFQVNNIIRTFHEYRKNF